MKRFTETQKWDDPWFRKLKPEMKLLWQWLLDRCDNAGIIDLDIEMASFQIGYPYPMDTLLHTLLEFGERVHVLPCGKYFIPKFIPFQYGKISSDCKAHNPVFQSLEKHGLKGYPKGIHTLQEEEEVKDKVKAKAKNQEKDARFTNVDEWDSDTLSLTSNSKPLCTLQQAIAYAPNCKMTIAQAEHWWHTRNAAGWTKGSTGGGQPRKITSWQSDMATSASWVGESAEKANSALNGKTKKTGMLAAEMGIS